MILLVLQICSLEKPLSENWMSWLGKAQWQRVTPVIMGKFGTKFYRELKELSWTSRFESWEFVIIKLMLPCKWYPLSFSVKFKAAITFTLVLWNALTFSLHVYHLATTHKILNFEHSKSLQKFYKIFLNFSIINFSQSINLNLTVKYFYVIWKFY